MFPWKYTLVLLLAELYVPSASGDESSGETTQPPIDESKVCDLSFTREQRSSRTDMSTDCGDCNFDENLCGYQLVPADGWYHSDTYQNLRAYGDSGRFVYATEWFPQLQSPNVKNSGTKCIVKFNYAFSDYAKANLKLYLSRNNEKPIEIWTDTEATTKVDEPNKWYNATAYIGKVSGVFNIYFTPFFRGKKNYVSVDNVVFEDCSLPQKAEKCEESEWKCANGACVDTSMVCDFSDDCGDNSDENECAHFERMDFDTTAMEGWQGIMESSNDNHWRVIEAQPSVAKSPTRDHTTNNARAKFAIVYNSSNALVSPSIKNSDQCSMRFFVNSCIKGIGHIEVNVTTGDESDIHVTHLLHNQTLYFRRHVIDFSSLVPKDTEFSVKLTAHIVPEAEKLDTACHYFAIDDISFTPKCFQKPQTATSTSSDSNTSSSQNINANVGTLIINLIAMCLIVNRIIH